MTVAVGRMSPGGDAQAPDRGGPPDTIRKYLPILPAAGFLAVTFVYPLVYVFLQSFGSPNFTLIDYGEIFTQPLYSTILLRTLGYCAVVSTISLVIGYPFAFFLTLCTARAARLLLLVVVAPMWTSVLVRSYALSQVLGTEGPLNKLLRMFGFAPETGLAPGLVAVVIGMVQIQLPLMIVTLYGGLRARDTSLEAAAQSMGASWPTILRRVTMPMSWPTIVSSYAIIFLWSLASYTVPAVLGGPSQTMIAQVIGMNMTVLLDWGLASALATVLTVVTFLIYAVYLRFAPTAQAAGGRS